MVEEIDRVLAPGGRYITFSLHPLDDVIRYFSGPGHDWVVSGFRAPSSRWDEGKNRRRAFAHSMIICDKPTKDGVYHHNYPLEVPGTLSEEEFRARKVLFDKVNFEAVVRNASVEKLFEALDTALTLHMDHLLDAARHQSNSQKQGLVAPIEADEEDVDPIEAVADDEDGVEESALGPDEHDAQVTAKANDQASEMILEANVGQAS
jgi:hypothetical protein